MMVEKTQRSCEQYLIAARREDSNEQRASNYTGLFLHWKLRVLVRWISDWDKGGVYQSHEL